MRSAIYIGCFVALLGFAWAYAAEPASVDNGYSGRGQPLPANAEMKAAFETCKPYGKPGEKAFDDCMTSKGFKKPEGGKPLPPRGEKQNQGNQPKASSEMKSAFNACKQKGKPGDKTFEDCMTRKGFKKPEGANRSLPEDEDDDL